MKMMMAMHTVVMTVTMIMNSYVAASYAEPYEMDWLNFSLEIFGEHLVYTGG